MTFVYIFGEPIHTVDGRNPKQPPGMYKTLWIMDFFHQQYEYIHGGSMFIWCFIYGESQWSESTTRRCGI